jgi:hypothetical protein
MPEKERRRRNKNAHMYSKIASMYYITSHRSMRAHRLDSFQKLI